MKDKQLLRKLNQYLKEHYDGGFFKGRLKKLQNLLFEDEKDLEDEEFEPSVSETHAQPKPAGKPKDNGTQAYFEDQGTAPISIPDYRKREELAARIQHLSKSFSETLLDWIDRKGMTDVECYRRAGVDRRHFSKIRSDRDYAPTKATVIAFALALKLNLNETNHLLSTAGYTLNHSSKTDVIVEFFIANGIYEVELVDEALVHYGQKTILKY